MPRGRVQQFEVVYPAIFLPSNMTQTFNVKLARYYRTLITKSPTVGRVFTERARHKVCVALRDI